MSDITLKKIGLFAAASFVISNMIGTGVFTSLGFQLKDFDNVIVIISLWLLGGLLALCGALVYSELGAVMPRSGGEYHYLTHIYHPALGFASGWVSMTVGFAAPAALSCMAFGRYSSSMFPFASPKVIALTALTLFSLMHCYRISIGSRFQAVITSLNIGLIALFIISGFLFTPHLQNLSDAVTQLDGTDFIRPEYAVALIYVMYSYFGWNASAYIANDIDNPQRNIPRSILLSTGLVTLLYLLLNYTFMFTTPVSEMIGRVEVGFISAQHIFGQTGAQVMSVFISLLLLASISSMVFIGPRVSQVMGEDHKLLFKLSYKNRWGSPGVAIFVQYCFSVIFIATSTFEAVLTYTGFTLNLFIFLAVMGLFVHRRKHRNVHRPYKTPGYPAVPLVFLFVVLMTLIYLLYARPQESILGLTTVATGFAVYYFNRLYSK